MIVYLDTETHAFAPGRMAPPVVCLQFCVDDEPAHIVVKPDIYPTFRSWLERGALLVGHNVCYDLACLMSDYPDLTPLIWNAYRSDLVADTMLRQKLADVGRGRFRTRRYDLGSVSQIHGGPVLNKDDPWRTRYAELENVPLADWPEEAIRYALLDAEATRAAYLGQQARYAPELLADACSQGRKFWALQLASVWGIRTSARGVASLREGVEKRIEQLRGLLVEEGLVRRDGSRDTTKAKMRMREVCEALGVPIVPAGKGKFRQEYCEKAGIEFVIENDEISLSSDACDATEDELLKAYTEYSSMAKTLSTDVPMLERGLVMPLHSHFDLVESGRTSSAKPNVQNIKRNGLRIREAFVPRGFRDEIYALDTGAKKS